MQNIFNIWQQIENIVFFLQDLAVPSVAFEPRFRGSFRNLLYAKNIHEGPEKQEMMAYKVCKELFNTTRVRCQFWPCELFLGLVSNSMLVQSPFVTHP